MPSVWFLTHPQVDVDPETPVPQWSLSPVGRARAAALAGAPFLRGVSAVWSSTETKARETAALLTTGEDLPVLEHEGLGENDRSSTGYLPAAEFESLARRFFRHPGRSVRGWETADHAQRRVVDAVRTVIGDARSGDGDVVVVAHGGVGTLLLCHLAGVPVSGERDQPGQGHFFRFDRGALSLRQAWRPLEDLVEASPPSRG
jgi:broad specificity phosphatase PhoE